MKKLYIIAALLMATTSAQAGGITFQINGERVRVEAPRNCNAISCVKVTSPGYTGTLGNVDLKGMGSRSKDDDDVAATAPAAPAPAQADRAAAPRSDCGDARTRSNNRRGRLAGTNRSCPARSASAARARRRPAPAPRRLRQPQPPRPTRRSASGRRKRTRATFASRNAAPICAVFRQHRCRKS